MKQICFYIIIFMAVRFLPSCSPPPPLHQWIVGAWQVDSVCYHENGFVYNNRRPSVKEVFYYRADSTVIQEGMERQLLFYYQLQDSMLYYYDANKNLVSDYTIQYMDIASMVLKRRKSPVFAGSNQEKYEVRYFSKIATITGVAHPLKGGPPR